MKNQNAALWEKILRGELQRPAPMRQVLSHAEEALNMEIHSPLGPAIVQELFRQVPPYVVIKRPEQALVYSRQVQESLLLQALFDIYDQLCKEEFAELKNKGLGLSFWDNNQCPLSYRGIHFKEDWQYYQWLRPFYYRKGITDPVYTLTTRSETRILPNATFLGLPVIGGANQKLMAIMAQAERELDRMGATALVKSLIHSEISGFVPRPIAEGNEYKFLSNHALGQAIDIEPETNPYIERRPAREMDELLAYLKVPYKFTESFLPKGDRSALTEEQIATAYSKAKTISDAIVNFLRQWLDPWDDWEQQQQADLSKLEELKRQEKKQAAARDAQIGMDKSYVKFLEESKKLTDIMNQRGQQEELIKEHGKTFTQNEDNFVYMGILVDALGGIAEAQKCQMQGLITLPLQLYIAMKNAGAKTGALDYVEKKDFMHFEAPDVH